MTPKTETAIAKPLGVVAMLHQAGNWVFRTNVTAGFGIVTEDFGPS